MPNSVVTLDGVINKPTDVPNLVLILIAYVPSVPLRIEILLGTCLTGF